MGEFLLGSLPVSCEQPLYPGACQIPGSLSGVSHVTAESPHQDKLAATWLRKGLDQGMRLLAGLLQNLSVVKLCKHWSWSDFSLHAGSHAVIVWSHWMSLSWSLCRHSYHQCGTLPSVHHTRMWTSLQTVSSSCRHKIMKHSQIQHRDTEGICPHPLHSPCMWSGSRISAPPTHKIDGLAN